MRSYVTIGRQAMAATGYEDGDLLREAIELLREHLLAVERRRFGDNLALIDRGVVQRRLPAVGQS